MPKKKYDKAKNDKSEIEKFPTSIFALKRYLKKLTAKKESGKFRIK